MKVALSTGAPNQKLESAMAKPLKNQAFATPDKVAELVQKVGCYSLEVCIHYSFIGPLCQITKVAERTCVVCVCGYTYQLWKLRGTLCQNPRIVLFVTGHKLKKKETTSLCHLDLWILFFNQDIHLYMMKFPNPILLSSLTDVLMSNRSRQLFRSNCQWW